MKPLFHPRAADRGRNAFEETSKDASRPSKGMRTKQAFAKFWGKRAKYPRFKKKRNGGSAEFTKSAFKFRDGRLWLAKCQEPLNIIWSRYLPEGCTPSTVTVKLDPSGRWFVSMLVDDYTIETG